MSTTVAKLFEDPTTPTPGSCWRHSKSGKVYVVIGLSMGESDGRIDVHYCDPKAFGTAEHRVPWRRPLKEWKEKVKVPYLDKVGGLVEVERFVRVVEKERGLVKAMRHLNEAAVEIMRAVAALF